MTILREGSLRIVATEIKIWEVHGKEIKPSDYADGHDGFLESELETWIANAPEVLADNLLIIDRQREIPGVGRLDLLCIDATGQLVVIELKRDLSARETVAQALDYASWLNDTETETIEANAKEYLGQDLLDAFEGRFSSEMPEVQPQNHKIVLVASRLDASAERIVNYLRERYGVELNVLLFKHARLSGGHEILVRTMLLPESTVGPRPPRPSSESLASLAAERNIEQLVDICRAIGDTWEERPATTLGGSFRYAAAVKGGGRRIVFGVNVAGGLASSAKGKLDVWVRPYALFEVTGIPEEEIRAKLRSEHHVVADNPDSCRLQLSTPDEANRFMEQLRRWARPGQ
ncbi:MAG TPA: endonuclease NucS domain-containing protein [Terriglobia bacterium]|nr:endonuclease NucS domain-containing protein [Terriglobia bacterium]